MSAACDRHALRRELEAFTIDFWHHVDFKGATGAADWYVEDAVFATSVREYRGRAQLEAFYARRTHQAPRVSVHVLSNFRLGAADDPRVHCHYVLALFAADGRPVLPSRAPVMLATVDEIVTRTAKGWRYVARYVHPLFRDGTSTRG